MRTRRFAAGKNSAKCGAGATDVRISCTHTSTAAIRDEQLKYNLNVKHVDPKSIAHSNRYVVPSNTVDSECAHATVASHYDTFKVII